MITNSSSGTNVHEVATGIYRINTPVEFPGGSGAFNFNQYLIADDEPLLFHTGPRRMFPLVSEAVARVVPLQQLRYLAFSHFEADECGSLNEFLAVAPNAVPVCSRVAAMVSVDDVADRPARPLADGEVLKLGRHERPLVRHASPAARLGMRVDDGVATRTLLCGDLFTQGGTGETPLTESDILGPSEAFRGPWITTRTPRTPERCSSGWPPSDRKCWPACMAAPGVAMVPPCCATSRRTLERKATKPD